MREKLWNVPFQRLRDSGVTLPQDDEESNVSLFIASVFAFSMRAWIGQESETISPTTIPVIMKTIPTI